MFFFFTDDEADTAVPVDAVANSKQEQKKIYTDTLFESIKHINDYGQEFWYARELQTVLEYKRWDKFQNVIDKAMNACKNSKNSIDDHFSQVGKMVDLGSGAQREIQDYEDRKSVV